MQTVIKNGQEMIKLELLDGKKIYVPKEIDASDLNFFDEIEYDMWDLIQQYLAIFGIQIDNDDPDWATVKEVQDTLIDILERCGVNFNWTGVPLEPAIYPNVKKLIAGYINDYVLVIMHKYPDKYEDKISFIKTNYCVDGRKLIEGVKDKIEFTNIICEDLLDKGFTNYEINHILSGHEDEDINIIYKITAYLLSLYNVWNNVDDLKKLISEPDVPIGSGDFTDIQLSIINSYYSQIG